MRIALHSALTNYGSVTDVLDEVDRAAAFGLHAYWAPMLGGQDTLTVLALAGARTPTIRLGTAVVPMPLRSPFALAQQTRTVQDAVDGRLSLAVGTSHERITEDLFGVAWKPPVAAARAYLVELQAILTGTGARRLAGEPARSTEVLLGAVNPAMIQVAAELAAGLVTWCAGEATLQELVKPAVRDTGRLDSFRVIAALPVTVTDDAARARQHIDARLGGNDRLPSYQKVLQREGATGVAELAVVGSAAEVRERLTRLADAGATEFAAHVVADRDSDLARTWELLGELAAEAPRVDDRSGAQTK